MPGWPKNPDEADTTQRPCGCCKMPCGLTCIYGVTALLEVDYVTSVPSGPNTVTTTYSATQSIVCGDMTITRSCCPDDNPDTKYSDIVGITSAGRSTCDSTEVITDAPVSGSWSIVTTDPDGNEIGRTEGELRLWSFDIGFFTTHTGARLIYRDTATGSVTCNEVDALELLGIDTKVYQLNVTGGYWRVTVNPAGPVGKCEEYYETCPGPAVFCYDEFFNTVTCGDPSAVYCYDANFILTTCP